MDQISEKVSQVTDKYEDLKKKQETPAKIAIEEKSAKSKEKVEKYAQMLK